MFQNMRPRFGPSRAGFLGPPPASIRFLFACPAFIAAILAARWAGVYLAHEDLIAAPSLLAGLTETAAGPDRSGARSM